MVETPTRSASRNVPNPPQNEPRSNPSDAHDVWQCHARDLLARARVNGLFSWENDDAAEWVAGWLRSLFEVKPLRQVQVEIKEDPYLAKPTRTHHCGPVTLKLVEACHAFWGGKACSERAAVVIQHKPGVGIPVCDVHHYAVEFDGMEWVG